MLQFYYMYTYTLCHYTVAAQEARNIVIVHPGQNFELSCRIANTTGNRQFVAWLVDNMGPYKVNSLLNGILTGYSSNILGTSIIIQNIMMNDRRNGTEYQCLIIRINSNVVLHDGEVLRVYVAGEFQHVHRWILLML